MCARSDERGKWGERERELRAQLPILNHYEEAEDGGNACLMMYVTSCSSWMGLLRITSSIEAFDGVKRNLQSWSGKREEEGRERVEKSWTKREGEKGTKGRGKSSVSNGFRPTPNSKRGYFPFLCSFPAMT